MDINNNLISLNEISQSDLESKEYVYVGRSGKGVVSIFGNPIKSKEICPFCQKTHLKKGDTLSCYEKYLLNRIKTDLEFKNRLKELYGKKLVCFCSNKNFCHGSIMIKYINILNDNWLKIK